MYPSAVFVEKNTIFDICYTLGRKIDRESNYTIFHAVRVFIAVTKFCSLRAAEQIAVDRHRIHRRRHGNYERRAQAELMKWVISIPSNVHNLIVARIAVIGFRRIADSITPSSVHHAIGWYQATAKSVTCGYVTLSTFTSVRRWSGRHALTRTAVDIRAYIHTESTDQCILAR